MSSRNLSVVVEPERWDDSLDALARLLAPVTRTRPDMLKTLLARGPVTLESDLTPSEARNLSARLEAMGVPCEISGAEPDLARTIADNPDIDAMLNELGIATIEVAEDAELFAEVDRRHTENVAPTQNSKLWAQAAEPRQSSPEPPSHADEQPAAARTLLGGFQSFDHDVQAVLKKARSEDKSPGWNQLFPDLDSSEEPAAPHKADPTPSGARTLDVEGLEELLEKDTRPETTKPPEKRPAPNAGHVSPAAPKPAKLEESPDILRRDDAVAAARLSRAFLDSERKPPYAPSGFDPRPEHPPGIAALFSVIAPGAGQIFNGDDEDALTYAWQAVVLVPWYWSVRDAHRKAEKIRDYWAPRPEAGTTIRALKYTFAWWVAAASVVFMIGWFSTTIYDVVTRPALEGVTEADVTRAFDDAKLFVTEARVDGLDALASAQVNAPRKQFTMDDEERAERLFRIGYSRCTAGQFAACQSAMKKVTALDKSHRRAFRLQTWASTQHRTPDGSPMPDVGEIEPLSEFEIDQHRKGSE